MPPSREGKKIKKMGETDGRITWSTTDMVFSPTLAAHHLSVCLEKVFCTVGLRRRVEKGTLGFRDDSHDTSSQMILRVL